MGFRIPKNSNSEGEDHFAKSSLSCFAQKYHRKWEETYFILQNKYLCIYKDRFGVKILGDDCAL